MNTTKFLHFQSQLFTSPIFRPSLFSKTSPPPFLSPIRSSNDDSNEQSVQPPLEIKFRRGSRKRRKQLQQLQQPKSFDFNDDDDDDDDEATMKRKPEKKKNWEEMSLSEKALELYLGEKGLLFWVNKFAYASIFIIIGAWIVFRFVGPALNLYQLDSPPLSPESVFKG